MNMIDHSFFPAQALALHGMRPALDGCSRGFEELHLFRCKAVPKCVITALQFAAGEFGFKPRRSHADYVRKGPSSWSWAGWAWQEALLRAELSQQQQKHGSAFSVHTWTAAGMIAVPVVVRVMLKSSKSQHGSSKHNQHSKHSKQA